MTPEKEKEYFEFVRQLGLQRGGADGPAGNLHTDQMPFDLLHMITGMCSEVGEIATVLMAAEYNVDRLDSDKFKDELGDLFFYLCGATMAIKSPFSEIVARSGPTMRLKDTPNLQMIDTIMKLTVATSNLIDVLKKHMAYHRTINTEKIKWFLGEVLVLISDATIESGTTVDEIVDMNVAKLKARYPNGYTHRDANNRNTQAETEAQLRLGYKDI